MRLGWVGAAHFDFAAPRSVRTGVSVRGELVEPWLRFALALAAAFLFASFAAQAQVGVIQAPVDRAELEGGIAGWVCEDLNRDGRCQADEPGLSGVRLVLETGQAAVTDGKGRYHFAAVPSRVPSVDGHPTFSPGRHRLRLDRRSLSGLLRPNVEVATVEVPAAGLVQKSFAVQRQKAASVDRFDRDVGPPAGEIGPEGRIRFRLSGVVEEGNTLMIDGAPIAVERGGRFRHWVTLAPGRNTFEAMVRTASGELHVSTKIVDLVARSGGFLAIPRADQAVAALTLPAARGEIAAAGRQSIRLEAPPGTEVRLGEERALTGADGTAQLVASLKPGANQLSFEIQAPGAAGRRLEVELEAAPRPLWVGLLDLEASFGEGGLRLDGRGAGFGELLLGRWSLQGMVDLRDEDAASSGRPGAGLLTPRRPERLYRHLDPEQFPIEWADLSGTRTPNPAEGRLSLQASHPEHGAAGVGTHRAFFGDAEVGRYHRVLFGPNARLRAKLSPESEVHLEGFAASGGADPATGLGTAPVHDELLATGGSAYFLSQQSVAQGSELVRVETQDALTGLPLSEEHLVRGRDYEIDYPAGRILLARPLSFRGGDGFFRTEAISRGVGQVLVVDYEQVRFADAPRGSVGGRLGGKLGRAHASVGAAREASADYSLVRGTLAVPVGPLTLRAEAARSDGRSPVADRLARSADGGLDFLRPAPLTIGAGEALSVRLSGMGFERRGLVDAAYRYRSRGFSDSSHQDLTAHRQLSFRGHQRFGTFGAGVFADDLLASDPRAPWSGGSIRSRTLGAKLEKRFSKLEVFAEGRDQSLTAANEPLQDSRAGGRAGVGLGLRYAFIERASLLASHHQAVAVRGAGPGAFDDSFTTVGLDVAAGTDSSVGLRAGYGRVLGPQVWGEAQHGSGQDTYYGTYSVDVDGPDFGDRRAVVGARTVDGETAVFVEDFAAHDTEAVRFGRSAGLSRVLGGGLILSGHYERGARLMFDVSSPLFRDAGAVSASLVRERFQLHARAEARIERGRGLLAPGASVRRVQQVGSLGAAWMLAENLRASARVNAVDSRAQGAREALVLESSASLAYRLSWSTWVLRYGLTREARPDAPAPRSYQSISLMPAMELGARAALAAGIHWGWSSEGGNSSAVLSGSLRPSVKVVAGLELAAEVAGRSSAPDRGELWAARGEVGYRVEGVLFAVGYTLFGFSGTGLPSPAGQRQDRAYVRAEVAY